VALLRSYSISLSLIACVKQLDNPPMHQPCFQLLSGSSDNRTAHICVCTNTLLFVLTAAGTCEPTPNNCVNTQPPTITVNVADWQCATLTGGDYAKRCVGTCSSGYTPLQGEDPAAHCNRYSGKWEVTGGCVQKACTSIPAFPPPAGETQHYNRTRLCVLSCIIQRCKL
jgi:hypothetical protein